MTSAPGLHKPKSGAVYSTVVTITDTQKCHVVQKLDVEPKQSILI
jgi:hypothetical protein